MEWAVQLWQCNAASLSLVRPYKQWEDVNNKFAFFFRKMPLFIADLGWLSSDRKSTYTSFAFHSVHFIGRNENPSAMKCKRDFSKFLHIYFFPLQETRKSKRVERPPRLFSQQWICGGRRLTNHNQWSGQFWEFWNFGSTMLCECADQFSGSC